MIKHLKEEIQHELSAARNFVNMAITFYKLGMPELANHFLRVAREDIDHAFEYGELDFQTDPDGVIKMGDLDITVENCSEIIKAYIKMESDACARIELIQKELRDNGLSRYIPKLDEMIIHHQEEEGLAKNMLKKVQNSLKSKNYDEIDDAGEQE